MLNTAVDSFDTESNVPTTERADINSLLDEAQAIMPFKDGAQARAHQKEIFRLLDNQVEHMTPEQYGRHCRLIDRLIKHAPLHTADDELYYAWETREGLRNGEWKASQTALEHVNKVRNIDHVTADQRRNVESLLAIMREYTPWAVASKQQDNPWHGRHFVLSGVTDS